MFSVEFRGLDKAIRDLGAYTDDVILALQSALFIEGEETMAESKPLVPVDEGVLRASGFEGYCLSESPATKDPLHVMRYYKALWEELTRAK
ncbi:MAG: HK97 gp10 family phage protein [Planctomycetes bacterium]|nr:HK97 gp10 family phage protein [Planctomycetota bacterium]